MTSLSISSSSSLTTGELRDSDPSDLGVEGVPPEEKYLDLDLSWRHSLQSINQMKGLKSHYLNIISISKEI